MHATGEAAIDSGDGAPWKIEFQQLVNESALLNMRLNELSEALFAPADRKVLRKFNTTETANLLDISDTYLREITAAGLAGDVQVSPTGRRFYSLAEINQIRLHSTLNCRPPSMCRVAAMGRRAKCSRV